MLILVFAINLRSFTLIILAIIYLFVMNYFVQFMTKLTQIQLEIQSTLARFLLGFFLYVMWWAVDSHSCLHANIQGNCRVGKDKQNEDRVSERRSWLSFFFFAFCFIYCWFLLIVQVIFSGCTIGLRVVCAYKLLLLLLLYYMNLLILSWINPLSALIFHWFCFPVIEEHPTEDK
jgi:hypothetical protein